jgi:integrase
LFLRGEIAEANLLHFISPGYNYSGTGLDALKAIENGSPYYFGSGKGEAKGALNVWHRVFIKLLELAKVEGHPHMYRHTMAIDLLENGVTVEQVAAILGNTPTIVYKHYAPWVASRQKALDAAVMSVWS